MKQLFLFIGALFIYQFSFGQMEEHAFFKASANTLSENEAEIIVDAKMDKGWHLYANPPGGDGMLIPTEITITKNSNITLVGKPRAIGKIVDEDIKGVGIVHYYKEKVQYVQKIKFKTPGKVKVNVYYQTCDDKGCLPPTSLDFNVDVKSLANQDDSKLTPAQIALNEKRIKDSVSLVEANLQKEKDSIEAALRAIATQNESNATANAAGNAADASKETYGEYGKIVGDCGEVQDAGLSMWTAFLYGILGGLAALFFPCTLPMIPMTISFFLKSAGDKRQGIMNGGLYGFSIFLVYFLLSLPFLFLGWGGNALNSFSTNVWVNLAFFAIFIVFAFYLFGFYDISLPSSMTNKIDAKSNTKSFGGIFFMALTLAIVSFSCTGPILGLVLGNISNSKLITPAMSGFGIGLGVPFALFAMFPNLLKALPKSGGWLTVLKVVFGFIELAFALKFLSNADLVKQWGFLKRELFIGLWILICVLTALYLLGIFKLKKDDSFKSTKVMKVIAGLCIVFALYLSTDFIGKEIKLVSGFPPPKFYSWFHKEEKLAKGEAVRKHNLKGIDIFLYLEDALEEGKRLNKPVMIDFTGWACVNCRKMEENVWTKSKVNSILSEDYVVASLYVDEQIALPENEQFMSPYLKRMATTVGDKWFDLSLRNFRAASQPYYVLIDPINHRILNSPRAYTPDENEYAKFLKCGVTNFKSLHP